MTLPAGGPQVARYTVVPLIGPDGVGKTSLLHALAAHVQRRDGLPALPLRSVATVASNATVLDARAPYGVFQHVDFPSAALEGALLGSSQFRGAVLVVSALESAVEGTVQSLLRAREAGIPRVAVALTKCDLVEDSEMTDLVEMELRELLKKYEYDGENAPVGRLAVHPETSHDHRRMAEHAAFFDAVQRWIQ